MKQMLITLTALIGVGVVVLIAQGEGGDNPFEKLVGPIQSEGRTNRAGEVDTEKRAEMEAEVKAFMKEQGLEPAK